DEEVRGDGEYPARLAYAAQVSVQHQECHGDSYHHRVRNQRWIDGGERRCARGGLYRNGDDVIDEQRDGRDLSDLGTEVVSRDDVGASRSCVSADDLQI